MRGYQGGVEVTNALIEEGVECVFGIPATHVIEVYEALRREPSFRSVVGRNEQATAYMADGYARRSRQLGVTVVTGGPGLGNTVTGLQCAWADSVPMLVITSDLDDQTRAAGRSGIPHETFDSFATAASTGAVAMRADLAGEISKKLKSTVEEMTSGRNRPGVLLVSRSALETQNRDLIDTTYNSTAAKASKSIAKNWNSLPEHLEPKSLDLVIETLRSAKRPLLLAGMGVYWSSAEKMLLEFLEVNQIPCLTTVPATGVIPISSRAPMGIVSQVPNQKILEEADVILTLGSSFGAVTSRSSDLKLNAKLIHVDVDQAELGRQYKPFVQLRTDPKTFLEALDTKLAGQSVVDAGVWKPSIAVSSKNPWVNAIREATEGLNTTIMADVCITSDWLFKGELASENRKIFMPWNYMNLGWAYAAALGAQAAAPDDFVIAVMGDGGALFTMGEASTAVESKLPVCLLVFNNNKYGTIALVQDSWFDGQRFDVDIDLPDWGILAKSFGLTYEKCETPESLSATLRDVAAARRPSIVEVPIDLAEQNRLSSAS